MDPPTLPLQQDMNGKQLLTVPTSTSSSKTHYRSLSGKIPGPSDGIIGANELHEGTPSGATPVGVNDDDDGDQQQQQQQQRKQQQQNQRNRDSGDNTGSSTPPPPERPGLAPSQHNDAVVHVLLNNYGSSRKHIKIAPTTEFCKILRAFSATGKLRLVGPGIVLEPNATPASIGVQPGWNNRVSVELVPYGTPTTPIHPQQQQPAMTTTTTTTSSTGGAAAINDLVSPSSSPGNHDASVSAAKAAATTTTATATAAKSTAEDSADDKVLFLVHFRTQKCKFAMMSPTTQIGCLLQAFNCEGVVQHIGWRRALQPDDTPQSLGLKCGRRKWVSVIIVENAQFINNNNSKTAPAPPTLNDVVHLNITSTEQRESFPTQQVTIRLHTPIKNVLTALSFRGHLRDFGGDFIDSEATPAQLNMRPGRDHVVRLDFVPATATSATNDGNTTSSSSPPPPADGAQRGPVIIIEGVAFDEMMRERSGGCSSCGCVIC